MLWFFGIIFVGGLLIYFFGPDVGKDTDGTGGGDGE
jgi:hypothetical protein